MLSTLLFNVVTKSGYTLMIILLSRTIILCIYNIFVMQKEAQLEQPTGVAHLYTLYTVHSHINVVTKSGYTLMYYNNYYV